MNFTRNLLIVSVAVLQSACAVISKTECLGNDWHSIGYELGRQGETQPSKAFAKRAKICAKYEVRADQGEYRIGYEEGLLAYCDVDNAVKLGVRGDRKALRLCREDLHPGFSATFDSGFQLYELRSDERAARRELERMDATEQRIRQRVYQLRNLANANDATESRRRNAIQRIGSLRHELRRINHDRRHFEERYYHAREASEAYQELLSLEYDDL